MKMTKELLKWIDQSPTAFHAVQNSVELLQKNGFLPLFEGGKWNIEPGKGYYVTRNQSSLIAFRVPATSAYGFMITASHTDSPMFKLKPEALSPSSCGLIRLNTELYGGAILSSWLDRPLSLAGRVTIFRGGVFEARLVNFDRDMLIIPNVAIHQNRKINSGFEYNLAVDMLPLFSDDPNASVKALVAEELKVREEDVRGMDLYVYNRMKGTLLGSDSKTFFSAPRIDNLASVFTTLQGFIKAENAGAINVFYSADNEETGSVSKQGAASVFLSDVLDRICEGLGTDKRQMLASSMMLSCDNAHAKHPNHPELSDVQNAPVLGGGVVIKSNAAQKYTTDGLSLAVFEEICRGAEVPVQYFATRSDLQSGSTLGSIANTNVPVMSVDIGIAQLSMHSAYETAHVKDVGHMIRVVEAFYRTSLDARADGTLFLQQGNDIAKENADV